MALAATQFTSKKTVLLGAGMKMSVGTFTGPASYTSGGEDMTNALAKAIFGMVNVKYLSFTPLVDNDNAALAVGVAFDHAAAGSSQGKIRFVNALGAHLHSFLVKGGTAAAGTDTMNIKSLVIGKEEATDRTNLGGTNGGVQNATAVVAGSEVVAATDLSGYVCRFMAIGN